MSDTLLSPAISPADARRIDDACDAFEAAWKAGSRPRLEEYLGAAGDAARPALLRQLLLLDWEYRRRAGDDPAAADYLPRLPNDATQVESLCRELAASPDPTWLAPDGSAVRGAEPPPAGTDRYELLNEVGRGGIGVILRGRDRHLGRELAVKVLRESHRDQHDARARFVAEARICSQLQHPAIVPVYELGRFDDGRPFITMKLVQGHTLAALLKGRANPADDQPRLLGVFEQVCQAVAYAHSRGVVHRDVKPANVMVGAFGEVQVMDWGFAKVLSDGDGPSAADTRPAGGAADVTQTGTLMGTPSYMPPEQARGLAALAGPPADVFALGAILCEILTGHPPYPPGTADEVCYNAAVGNLDEARARLDACGADESLRQLAVRCLAAEPSARPATAGVVAEALTAHLASAQERLRQTQLDRAAAEARAQEAAAKARAERRARGLTLALAAALMLGAAAAWWQAVVARRAERDAMNAAAERQQAKDTADAKAAETRAVLDFVQNRILAAARPEGQDGGLGRDVSLRKALEAALPAVATQFAGQPLTEARLRVTLGDSFQYLNEPQKAADQFERARALYAQHLGPDHVDSVECTDKLAQSYADLGRHPEALKLREEALARNTAAGGPDHPNTLSASNNLTLSYQALGRDAEALKLREELLPRFRATFGPDDIHTLRLMTNLALSYQAAGRQAEALKLREAVLPLLRAKLAPDHPETLRLMNAVAGSYYMLGRYADALALAGAALPLQKAKLGPGHTHTLQTANTMAGCLEALGRHAEALPLFEEILATRKARFEPGHPSVLVSMNNLANSYAALGRHAEALKLREETLALRRAKFPADHPDITWSMSNLANSYADLDRHADALKLREEVLAKWKAKLGPDHPDTLWGMGDVAASLVKLGRGAEAVPLIDECVRRSAGQAVHPDLVPKAMNLRLRHFERAKDVARCRETAERWEALGRTDADSLYDATCFRAVTATVARAADPSPAGREQSDAEAARAVAWLGRAIAAGYKDVSHVADDADLNVLRDRADFRKLMAKWKPGR